MVVQQGDTPSYRLVGNPELINKLSIKIINQSISIERKLFNRLSERDSVTVFVILKEVTLLSVSGPGTLEAKSVSKGESIRLNNNGSGKLMIDELNYQNVESSVSGGGLLQVATIMADKFQVSLNGSGSLIANSLAAQKSDIRISGSGKVQLEGKSTFINCVVNGSGNLHAVGLQTKDAAFNISGSGNARINVLEKLEAKISGSGNIYYSGNPSITTKRSGGGRLERIRPAE